MDPGPPGEWLEEYRYQPTTAPIETVTLVVILHPVTGLRLVVGSSVDRVGTEARGCTFKPHQGMSQAEALDEGISWIREQLELVLRPALFP